jgi:hypothetical protein
MMCRKLTLIVSLVVVVCLVGLAPAAEITWSGGYSDESWCDPDNWIGGAEPNGVDEVTIGVEAAGVSIPIGCDANVGSIEGPDGATTIDIEGNLLLHGSFSTGAGGISAMVPQLT